MGWLELYAHGDVEAVETPVGMLPKYEDLKEKYGPVVPIDKLA